MEDGLETTSLPDITDIVTSGGITTATQSTIDTIFFIIGSVGIVGNACILSAFISSRRLLKSKTNCFLCNQTAIDLTASVLLVCHTALPPHHPPPGWLGEVYCRLWVTKVFLWGVLLSSTYNLLATTLERYLAIVWPVFHRNYLYRTSIVMVTVWLFGVLYNAAFKLPTTVVSGDGRCLVYGNYKPPHAKRVVGLISISIQFLLPIAALVYCYGHVIYSLRTVTTVTPMAKGRKTGVVGVGHPLEVKQEGANKPSGQPGRNSTAVQFLPTISRKMSRSGMVGKPANLGFRHTARQKAVTMLVTVSSLFFLCWVGNQLYFFLLNLGFNLDMANPFYHATVVLAYSNCCVNPVVYLALCPHIRRAVKHLLVKMSCGRTCTSNVTPLEQVTTTSGTFTLNGDM